MSVPEDEPDVFGEILRKLNCVSGNEKKKKRTVPRKEDPNYNMNHARRGLAVIFNHEHFDPPLNERFKQRKGTEFDCKCLEDTLKLLEFDEIDVWTDLNFEQLDEKLENISKMDFTDCDCLFITVLTHGEPNVLAAKDRTYVTNILFDRFTADNCPSLAGKPKIFVIQACQGEMVDHGVDVEADSGIGGGDLVHQMYCIPIHADFLIAYSTVPGYVSWRQTETGSWFIQTLCEELRHSWIDGSDLVVTMTNVNRKVAFNFQSYTPSNPKLHKKKQIPHFTSMLTRFVKFAPKTPQNSVPLNNNNNNNSK